jgi:hypothetical protein
MKGSDQGSLPGRFVVVVTQAGPADDQSRTAGALRTRFRSAHLAVCHRSGSGYSRPVSLAFGSPSALWDWLESPALSRRKTYVVCPCASDSLTLLRYWDRLETAGCKWDACTCGKLPCECPKPPPGTYIIRKMILRGMPDIIDYSRDGKSFRWLSAMNYYRDTEDKVARATGYKWRDESDANESGTWISDDPGERARMWLHAMTSLALWWRDCKAGRFPPTMASMGYAFLRSRIVPKSISSHRNPDVLSLERKACHGGRSTAWFTGDIRPNGRHTPPESLPYPSSGGAVLAGPIHHVDIRSMYPTLMRDNDFPAKFSHAESNIPVARLNELIKCYHVIARVALETEIAEYPYRTGERVVFPRGRFTSHLATPEIALALSDGVIRRVHEVACYYRGRPFTVAASAMLEMRAAAERAGNLAWAKFCKGISNAVTGKLAQRKGDWSPAPDVTAQFNWGEWRDVDRTSGTVLRYRALAGLSSLYTSEERGTGTHTAAYAVLTAYGRARMRYIRSLLPIRSVLSQDTDGMWITSAALDCLTRAHGLLGESPGLLRLTQSVTSARFWDSKHYYAGCGWTLAGLSSPVFVPGSSVYSDCSVVNPVRVAPLGPPSEIIEVKRQGLLECIRGDGITGEDGWMTPYRLPLGAPQRPDDPPDPQPSLLPD